MATPEDYKRIADKFNDRPGRGGIFGAAARLRAAVANGGFRDRGLVGLAEALRGGATNSRQPQQGAQPQQVNMPRMGMMGGRKMAEEIARRAGAAPTMKKGGKVKKMAKGGSASSRGDGIARKGKTKGRMV